MHLEMHFCLNFGFKLKPLYFFT